MIPKQLKRIQKDFLASAGPEQDLSPELENTARSLIFSVLLAGYIEQQSTAGNGPLSTLAITQTELSLDKLKQGLSYYDHSFGSRLFTCLAWPLLEKHSDKLKPLLQKLLKLSPGLNISDLICCFEGFLRQGSAKKDGVFYTPAEVAKAMVQEALANIEPGKHSPCFLDPACGSGIFLLELAIQCCQTLRYNDFHSRLEFVQRSIFGVDKDACAVEMSRLVLLLWLCSEKQGKLFQFELLPSLEKNIKLGDSLLSSVNESEQELFRENQLFDWKRAFPQVFSQNGGFDCVIGNPPYGLARGEQITSNDNMLLKSIYRQYRHGKINKYLAFMARGFELLRKDGVLSLLVPNSWLGIQGGKPIRQAWLEKGALKKINLFDCNVFEDPSVEAVSFIALKAGGCSEIELARFSALTHQHPAKTLHLSVAECLKTPDSVIPLNWSKPASDLYYQIREVSVDLASPESGFMPLIALQAYAAGKGVPPQTKEAAKLRIYHRNFKEDENTFPYLEGSDVARFHLNWSGSFLKFGPWLAETQSLERFSGPRILIREIIRPSPYLLAACLAQDTYLYNKSVLHIVPNNKAGLETLWVLLGILNSKLASFIINFAGRKSQRKLFPKIVNADLINFPLARNFLNAGSEISKFAKQLSELELPRDIEEQAAYNIKLNHSVYALYQLKNSQVDLIEKTFPG